MTPSTTLWTRTIPPSGAIILRRSEDEVPATHHAFGVNWSVQFPSELVSEGIVWGSNYAKITTSSAASPLESKIDAFWTAAVAAARPRALPQVPHSVAGIDTARSLSVTTTDNDTRRSLIREYLKARHAIGPATGVPPFVDQFLRQLAVLRLPSEAEARLWHDERGSWVVQFEEKADILALFDVMVWRSATQNADKKASKISARLGWPVTRGRTREKSELIALARAVQIAHIAIASGAAPDVTLRIETLHHGLGGQSMVLMVHPPQRGLPLHRLARRVQAAMAVGIAPPSREDMEPFQPRVMTSSAQPDGAAIRTHGKLTPIRWKAKAEGEGAARHWVYEGTVPNSRREIARLPFALTPDGEAVPPARPGLPTFGALDPQDRAAYLAWLDGARRANGATPTFCNLYLQGLEYRLLSETPAQGEAPPVVDEILAVTALLSPGSTERRAALGLLDWLQATGNTVQDPSYAEGPLSCLLRLGQKVVVEGALDRADLLALSRHLTADTDAGPDAPPPQALPETDAPFPVQAPRTALVWCHRSLSGLCDIDRHVFRVDGRPVPDLRRSTLIPRMIGLSGQKDEERGEA